MGPSGFLFRNSSLHIFSRSYDLRRGRDVMFTYTPLCTLARFQVVVAFPELSFHDDVLRPMTTLNTMRAIHVTALEILRVLSCLQWWQLNSVQQRVPYSRVPYSTLLWFHDVLDCNMFTSGSISHVLCRNFVRSIVRRRQPGFEGSFVEACLLVVGGIANVWGCGRDIPLEGDDADSGSVDCRASLLSKTATKYGPTAAKSMLDMLLRPPSRYTTGAQVSAREAFRFGLYD